MEKELNLKCNDNKVYFEGSSLTAMYLQSLLEEIKCEDVPCNECPLDSLHGCALVTLDNLLEHIE